MFCSSPLTLFRLENNHPPTKHTSFARMPQMTPSIGPSSPNPRISIIYLGKMAKMSKGGIVTKIGCSRENSMASLVARASAWMLPQSAVCWSWWHSPTSRSMLFKILWGKLSLASKWFKAGMAVYGCISSWWADLLSPPYSTPKSTLPPPILSALGGEQFLKQCPIISHKSMVDVWIYTWKEWNKLQELYRLKSCSLRSCLYWAAGRV